MRQKGLAILSFPDEINRYLTEGLNYIPFNFKVLEWSEGPLFLNAKTLDKIKVWMYNIGRREREKIKRVLYK